MRRLLTHCRQLEENLRKAVRKPERKQHAQRPASHPITEIQGTLYEVVFKRSAQGEMIVTKRPDMSHVEWSEAQKGHRQRFKQPVAQVRTALSDPAVCLRYERKAKKQKKRIWDVAMSNYFQGKGLFSKKETGCSERTLKQQARQLY